MPPFDLVCEHLHPQPESYLLQELIFCILIRRLASPLRWGLRFVSTSARLIPTDLVPTDLVLPLFYSPSPSSMSRTRNLVGVLTIARSVPNEAGRGQRRGGCTARRRLTPRGKRIRPDNLLQVAHTVCCEQFLYLIWIGWGGGGGRHREFTIFPPSGILLSL